MTIFGSLQRSTFEPPQPLSPLPLSSWEAPGVSGRPNQPSLVASRKFGLAKPINRSKLLTETPNSDITYRDVREFVEAADTRPAPRANPREGVDISKAIFTLTRADEVFAVRQPVVQN